MTSARTIARRICCAFTLAMLMVSVVVAANGQGKKAQDKKAAIVEKAVAVPSYYGPQPAVENIDLTMYARIRQEGIQHSHVMQFAEALNDGIGPRLTGSPNMAAANAWTRDALTKIGLDNAHLEDWGEFGMGWQQINTWVRLISPDPEPLWAQAAPWSPPTDGPVSGEVISIVLQQPSDMDTYAGKLK